MAKEALASILHALGTFGKTYGQTKLRSIEDEAATRKKTKEDEDKKRAEFNDQLGMFNLLAENNPKFRYVAERVGKLGRKISESELKLLMDAEQGERTENEMFGDELEKLMGQGGVNWQGAAQSEGIVPGMLATNEGRASAAGRLVDYGRFADLGMTQSLPNGFTGAQQPMLPTSQAGPMSVNPEWGTRVQEWRKSKALLKARTEKEVADIKNPPEPKLTPEQKGREDARRATAKQEAMGGAELTADDWNQISIRGNDAYKAEVDRLERQQARLKAQYDAVDVADDMDDDERAGKLAEIQRKMDEVANQIDETAAGRVDFVYNKGMELYSKFKSGGKKRTPSGVRPPEQMPKDYSKWTEAEKKYYGPSN